MEKRKLRFLKVLKKDFALRVLAVVLAVIIWFALSITLFPTVYMTISEVPVTVAVEGTSAGSQGLELIDFNDETKVEVSISGMRYEIGSFTSKDLHATVDTSGISEAGTYSLPVKVTSSADSMNVTAITPSTVKVKLDYIKTANIPLRVRASSISPAEGYSLGDPIITPETIQVKGEQKLVDKISYAIFAVDQKQTLTESYDTSDGKVYLYTDDGTLIDDKSFEISNDPISVKFPVYFLKTLNFTFDYQGAPENFDTSILKYTLSNDTIDVMTANDSILNQDDLHLGYINLSDIDLEKTFTFDVLLDSGVTSTSGINTVTVTFDPSGFVCKEFTIPESNIKIINAPANQDIRLTTKAVPNVKIYGPQSVMEILSADDIIAEFDMQSSVLEYGSYTRSVKIYAPQVSTVWCCGSYEIMFTVAEKKTNTTTTTTAKPSRPER